ncbi:MAG: hypothetical protein PHQ52_05830, partial [Candidatus Omnitrophica bacterium]|nr:hypothetical protein [Candidatus Omnitrophota bacterium]
MGVLKKNCGCRIISIILAISILFMDICWADQGFFSKQPSNLAVPTMFGENLTAKYQGIRDKAAMLLSIENAIDYFCDGKGGFNFEILEYFNSVMYSELKDLKRYFLFDRAEIILGTDNVQVLYIPYIKEGKEYAVKIVATGKRSKQIIGHKWKTINGYDIYITPKDEDNVIAKEFFDGPLVSSPSKKNDTFIVSEPLSPVQKDTDDKVDVKRNSLSIASNVKTGIIAVVAWFLLFAVSTAGEKGAISGVSEFLEQDIAVLAMYGIGAILGIVIVLKIIKVVFEIAK